MNYVIRDAAQEDIYEQYSFYFADRDSESLAQRFLSAIDVAIHEICRDPGIGSPRYEIHPSLQGLRSWQVKGFPATRIYYLVLPGVIRIVRVLHGRRNVATMLMETDDSNEDYVE